MRRRKIRYNDHSRQDFRSNSEDKRRRRAWILKTFGDGTTVECVHCGKKLTEKTMTIDRIIPGGRYTHDNIQPSCLRCNMRRSNKTDYVYTPEEIGMKKAFGLGRNPRRRKLKIVKKWRTKAYRRNRRNAA